MIEREREIRRMIDSTADGSTADGPTAAGSTADDGEPQVVPEDCAER